MEVNSKYRLLVISMFFVLLVFGICVGFNFSKSNKKVASTISNTEELINDSKDDKYEEKTDIELVYNDHYSLCGETITSSEMIYSVNIEKLVEDEIKKQKEKLLDYKIEEKTPSRLVFTRTVNQNCPNHFLVKLINGKVIIYSLLSDDLSVEYQTIDISQELIRPEMIEELNSGIRVDTKEELNFLIEDIES